MKTPLEPELKVIADALPMYNDLQICDIMNPKSEQLISITGDVMKKMIVRGQNASEVMSRNVELHDTIRHMVLEEVFRRWCDLKSVTDTDFADCNKALQNIGGGG